MPTSRGLQPARPFDRRDAAGSRTIAWAASGDASAARVCAGADPSVPSRLAVVDRLLILWLGHHTDDKRPELPPELLAAAHRQVPDGESLVPP